MPTASLATALSMAIAATCSLPALAGTYDGSSAANAGLSAAQILHDHPGAVDGVYWIDADGAGGAAAAQMYANMTVAGGGWMLVRHATNSGGWIGVTDSLAGTASLNAGQATDPLAAVDWTVPFGNAAGDFLFLTGDGSAWGVLSRSDVTQLVSGDNFAPNATVKASFGVGVAAGGMTNVLNRNGTGTGGAEDPWVGFEGGHIANIGRMMYGENSFGGGHASFKNAHQGVNVFVREFNVPTAPVPEPGSWALLLAGGAALGLLARRRPRA